MSKSPVEVAATADPVTDPVLSLAPVDNRPGSAEVSATRNALELDGVTKQFGSLMAVDHVSLRIEQGEFVTLLGPSGCGKSTLLRMIGGFDTPTSGRIVLDGTDVTDLAPNRRDVNMVFQDYALFPHMSVLRNVAYGLRRDGVGRRAALGRAREALGLVELADKADFDPDQLSGGQRQRVALARALVKEPKVLLLDEPLSALDAKLREQMQVELKSLHETVGTTFILVTHDQSEALSMSDRVAVMDSGTIVECAGPKELYNNPTTLYAATFVGAMNVFASEVRADGDGQIVDCFGQELLVDVAPTSVPAGTELRLGFRPDSATVVREQSADAGAGEDARRDKRRLLRGVIAETLYRGIDTVVTVTLDGASAGGEVGRVRVNVAGRSANGFGDIGSRIAIDPGPILVFEGSS